MVYHQPAHDTSTGLEQLHKHRNVTVPTFPYRETPILPPDLFVSGMTSKEGLQEVPNVDPFVIVKNTTLVSRLSPWVAEIAPSVTINLGVTKWTMDLIELKIRLIHSWVKTVATYGPNVLYSKPIHRPIPQLRLFLIIHDWNCPLLIYFIRIPLIAQKSSMLSRNIKCSWPMRCYWGVGRDTCEKCAKSNGNHRNRYERI